MFKSSQFIRYCFSGLFLNLFGFLLYIILLEFLNFLPSQSLSVSFPVTIFIYYLSQSWFVFKMQITLNGSIKFFSFMLFLYLLNMLLLFIGINKFHLNPIITQFLIICFMILLNYFIQKKIIFINELEYKSK